MGEIVEIELKRFRLKLENRDLDYHQRQKSKRGDGAIKKDGDR